MARPPRQHSFAASPLCLDRPAARGEVAFYEEIRTKWTEDENENRRDIEERPEA